MSIASISVETIVREHPELEMQLISGEKGISKKISKNDSKLILCGIITSI